MYREEEKKKQQKRKQDREAKHVYQSIDFSTGERSYYNETEEQEDNERE